MKSYLLTCFLIVSVSWLVMGQEGSLDFAETENEELVVSSFNGSTIVNTQSTNVVDKGFLNLLIAHRFGHLNEGYSSLFGLDYSAVRFGFEYGITKNITASIGRSSLGKHHDGSIKVRLLTQKNGGSEIPVTITLLGSMASSHVEYSDLKRANDGNAFVNSLVYTVQPLVSRQFSKRFSLQLTPTFIHRNSIYEPDGLYNLISLGGAARFQVSSRVHLNVDYHYVANNADERFNPLGIGVDIVTGGHVFKLHLTNSVGIIEKEYLLNTTDDFFNGDIRFGFTVLRSFSINPEVKGGKIK